MNYDTLQGNKYWSVTELTQYIRFLLESNLDLQDIWVSGEISNVSKPSSGHLYFTLKDRSSTLRCVMWRNHVAKLFTIPKEGNAVEVHGSVGVYEAGGQYQFYVDQIHSCGEGTLYREFIKLKEYLEKEGLFDPERKRPIPRWPHRIGIVTSPTGAALRDMLNIIKRRYSMVEVILSPSPVQGETAPVKIKESLQKVNDIANPDVILLARGGGSIEDLWAFNSEIVARAISDSKAPIICGVGHETDFTIADFVSDLRARTPTAAAELATPNIEDLQQYLIELQSNLVEELMNITTQKNHLFEFLNNRFLQHTPISKLKSNMQRIDILSLNLEQNMKHRLQIKNSKLEGITQKLNTLNPDTILKRGFAIVSKPNGQVVSSTSQVDLKESLNITLHEGSLGVSVKHINKIIP